MKTIERVITTDGGALDLATAILTIAYGLPKIGGASETLRMRLGLGDSVVHSVETAFSYPNAVALVRDQRGRKALYTFDSDQETLVEGTILREMVAPETYATDEAHDAFAAREPEYVRSPVIETQSGGAADVGSVAIIEGSAARGLPADAPELPAADDEPAVHGFGESQALGATGATDAGKLGDVMEVTPPGAGYVPAEPVATIVPGETPGYPIDGTTGEAIVLSAEEHEKLSHVAIGGDGSDTAYTAGYTAAEAQGLTDRPLGDGFAGTPVGDGSTVQAIEAAPGIGAGGEQVVVGESVPEAFVRAPEAQGLTSEPAPEPEQAMKSVEPEKWDETTFKGDPEPEPVKEDPEATLTTDPIIDGVLAYYKGVPRSDNPHTMGSPEYDQWGKGWDNSFPF